MNKESEDLDLSLEEFANKYFDWDMNESVPLGLLLAWISRNLERQEGWEDMYIYDRKAVVDVSALQKWATSVARRNEIQ